MSSYYHPKTWDPLLKSIFFKWLVQPPTTVDGKKIRRTTWNVKSLDINQWDKNYCSLNWWVCRISGCHQLSSNKVKRRGGGRSSLLFGGGLGLVHKWCDLPRSKAFPLPLSSCWCNRTWQSCFFFFFFFRLHMIGGRKRMWWFDVLASGWWTVSFRLVNRCFRFAWRELDLWFQFWNI